MHLNLETARNIGAIHVLKNAVKALLSISTENKFYY